MTGDLIGALSQGRQHIGELLVNLKKIDRQQLDSALQEQSKLNAKLGEVLVNKGFITQQELDYALAVQNNRNPQAPMMARKKLGDLLLETGKLTTAQLEAALQTQNLTDKKIGEVLLEMGFVTQGDIDSALSLQDSLAFSSRQRILDSLQARNAGEAAQLRATGPLPRELAEAYPNKARFLEAAAAKAFQSAFGRAPEPNELADYRAKLTFVFPEGKLADPLSSDFNRAGALQKLSSFFQNVIADRITQLAGGDTVQKKYDRLGNVEVTGLSPRDLEIAIEVATARHYHAQEAIERFLEHSPRAFFRSMLGRDFASPDEERRFEQLLDGAQGDVNRDILKRLQGILQDTFSAFPLARSDKAIRESLTLDEAELKDLLKAIRDFGEREALRLFQEKEFWFRKQELARQTESMLRAQLETIKAEQQVRKIMDLLERILGKIPPALMKLVRQMMSMVGGSELPNLGALESMILDLVEKIMQLFQSLMGRTPNPDELAQALEVVLGQITMGAPGDPMQVLAKHLSALKEGKSPQGGLSLDRAMGLVNRINFEFKGQFQGSVDAEDPWVQALVTGDQTPEAMQLAFKQYYQDGKQGIGLPEALAFVEFMNLSYKGVKLEADPFDPYVQKLIMGEMTAGEVDREWRAIFRGEGEAPAPLDTQPPALQPSI